MRKFQILFISFILATSIMTAQGGNRVEQAKIAFITQKLNLTTAEAEKFWPLYNEFRLKSKDLKKGKRGDLRDLVAENITDKEADELLQEVLLIDQKLLDLRKEYYMKFKQILPAKKVILLVQAEKEFNKELISFIKK